METENLFILKGLIIKPKTEADWDRECKIFNLGLPEGKEMPLEKFIEFQKGFSGCHDYVISDYNHAYFLNKDVAMSGATGDMGGLNDGGVYDYDALIEVPCGVSYPEIGEIISFHLFKYNYSTYMYEEIFTGAEYDACKKYFCIIE